MCREILMSVIFVPGNSIVVVRGRNDVDIPVPIHICSKYIRRTCRTGRYGVRCEDLLAVILIPGYCAVIHGSG